MAGRHTARVPLVAPSTVVALAAVATLGLLPTPLWVVTGALLVVAAALVTLAARDLVAGPDAALAMAALVLGIAVVAALPSAGLTALTTGATALAAGTLLALPRTRRVHVVSGALLPTALASTLWALGAVLDLDVAARGLPVLVAVGLVALALPRLEVGVGGRPGRARRRGRGHRRRGRPAHRAGAAPHRGRCSRDRDVAPPRAPSVRRRARRAAARRRDLGAAGRPRRQRAGGLHAAHGHRPGAAGAATPAPGARQLHVGAAARSAARHRPLAALGVHRPDLAARRAARRRVPRARRRRCRAALERAAARRRDGRRAAGAARAGAVRRARPRSGC